MAKTGEAAMAEGNWPAAAEAFANAVRLKPTDGQLRLQLARARMMSGNAQDAERAARAAALLDTTSGRPELLLGLALLQQEGRHEDGLAALRSSLALNPAEEEARAALMEHGELTRLVSAGDAANRRRDWPEASRHYAEALRLAPDLAPIWVQYGHALKERGLLPAAENAYRRAVLAADHVLDHHLQLGHALKMLGRHDEAMECFLRCVQIDEGHHESRHEVQRYEAQRAVRESQGQRVVAERLAEAIPFTMQRLELLPGPGLVTDRELGQVHLPGAEAEAPLALQGAEAPLLLPPGRYHLVIEARVTAGRLPLPRLRLRDAPGRALVLRPTELAQGLWGVEIESEEPLAEPTLLLAGPARFFLLRLDLLRLGGEGGYLDAGTRQTALKAARGMLAALPEALRADLSRSGVVRKVLAEFFPGMLVPGHSYFRDTVASGTRAQSAAHAEAYWRGYEVAANMRDADFGACATAAPAVQPGSFKAIAYYLPQMHPIAENDAWWGKGFTEWTNVSKAVPQFLGHYQPRLPGELGFYDLRVKDVMRRQIELAKLHGIHGFCFHYYWFAGKRLLEGPLEALLADPSLDMPFCLCWANENWTRAWDGAKHDVLMAQHHTDEDHERVFEDLLRHMRDPRYITVEGRPVVLIYRLDMIPDHERMVDIWRRKAAEAGLPGIYIVAAATFGLPPARARGMDAMCGFPPHGVNIPTVEHTRTLLNSGFQGRIYEYAEVAEAAIAELELTPHAELPLLPGVMPSWDNEARRPGRGDVYAGATPAMFHRWLLAAARHVTRHHGPAERLVFVNAWNEWAEGAYLEPDRRYGYAFLAAVREAVRLMNNDPAPLQEMAEAHNHHSHRRADTVVLLHAFYPDLVEEFAAAIALARKTRPLDVIVTVPDSWSPTDMHAMLAALDPVRVVVSANRGRDVWPFLQALRVASALGYEHALKLHTKKSPHRTDGGDWRRGLVGTLLAPASLATLEADFFRAPSAGMAVVEHSLMPVRAEASVTYNKRHLEALLERLGLVEEKLGDFAAGTMLWFRLAALEPLLDLGVGAEDFGPELGQVDATLAHAFERVLMPFVEQRGMQVLRLPDVEGVPKVLA
ncbi:glycoside hydrolase family 99-like domain-containing protein [Rhodovarius crocodyli]|uniref:glycoside hydrolase family 99-like domain-containing protein n=1 Tax=Rhodovarius crocodyli TaxID=1979269 RepID=UPI0013E2E27F|nr:glycoside hydrolase family 99-like domain-containing protein [Rhodovarius crocodyli]